MFNIRLFFIFISVLLFSSCMQTITVECGSSEANYLNKTLVELRNQTQIVKRGYKEDTQSTSTPYVTQYWNGYQYVSQTKYHYNSNKIQIPINMDYEKKMLQVFLNTLERAFTDAKNTQTSCLSMNKGTFTINHAVVQNDIDAAKFVLN
jgi:hypothetical protein